MAQPFPFERQEAGEAAGVVTIRLEQPDRPVVVLNRDLLHRLDATLDAIGATAKGLVLASASDRAFVAGADLQEIDGLSDEDLDDYLRLGTRVFARIAHMHCPTVAAINGATLGGGLELAMHCDSLIACLAPDAKRYPIGLPEASLGLCPGWGGCNMLPARMRDPARAILMTATGETISVIAARETGLLDELIDNPKELLPAARSLAASLTKSVGEREPRNIHEPEWRQGVLDAASVVRTSLPDTKPAKAVHLAVQTGLDLGWEAGVASERHLLMHLRRTPEGRAGVRAFLDKNKR